MDIFQTIVLGIIQGLGEFLPISSSAHLILLPWFVGWKDHGLVIDVALHIGTLFSVLIYYRSTWIEMASSLIKPTGENKQTRKLFFYIIIATIPGAILGLLGKDYAESLFRSPLLIATTLAVMGIFLWLCDTKFSAKTKSVDRLSIRDVLIIGISQGFAIIPGFSRSGTTISMALLLGYKRAEAANFSFYLSVPIIAGAAMIKMPEIIAQKLYLQSAFWLGIITAALVGYCAIAFLIRYVSSKSYLPFTIYRIALALAIVCLWTLRAS